MYKITKKVLCIFLIILLFAMVGCAKTSSGADENPPETSPIIGEKQIEDIVYLETYKTNQVINLNDTIEQGEIKSVNIGSVTISEAEYSFTDGELTFNSAVLKNTPYGRADFEIEFEYVTYKGECFVLTKLIETAEDLVRLNEYDKQTLSNGRHAYGGYFLLANNINASGYEILPNCVWSGYMDAKGREEEGFQGVLDGQGYTINGLTVGGTISYGIFGTIGQNGVIKNVAFTNVKYSTLRDDCAIGALAANLFGGTIENVFFHSESAFFAPITYISNGSTLKNVIFYGTHYQEAGLTLFIDYLGDNEEKVVSSNVYSLANKRGPTWGESYDMAHFDLSNYYKDVNFVKIDFQTNFDCSRNGLWKMNSNLLIPIFKTSNVGQN